MASGEVLSERKRLERIESLTDGTLAYLDTEDLQVELLDRVCEMLTVDAAMVLMLDQSRSRLVTRVARGIEEAVHQGFSLAVGQGFAGRIASEKAPVVVERPDDGLVENVLRERGLVSLMGVPLIGQGELIGVLLVGSLQLREFTYHDIDLLQSAGDRIALAIQAHTTRSQLSAAVVLQRSLLPPRLPPIAGLELAARYVPGEGGTVGGDWYDVFSLPSGHVCLIVGDVVGHGLPAAVVMGRLRSALRAYALTDLNPGEVLTYLDRKLRHFETSQMATILYGVFDPMLDKIHLSSAGHLPAMLTHADGTTVELEVPPDPPLGVPLQAVRRTTVIDIPVGGSLCLYTDGLVERRGAHLNDGLALLRQTLSTGDPEAVCSSIMATMVGRTQPRDDIAVLVVRREDGRSDKQLTVPAEPPSLAAIRMALRRWLADREITSDAMNDLLVAVVEASANSIQHAYGAAGGLIELEMRVEDDTVTVTVRDSGQWRPQQDEPRGWGLLLMEQCSDDLQIVRGANGTSVTITCHMQREEDS